MRSLRNFKAKGDELRVSTRAPLCSTAHTHIVGLLGLNLTITLRILLYQAAIEAKVTMTVHPMVQLRLLWVVRLHASDVYLW